MSADGNPDEMLFVFVYLPSIRSKGGNSTWENAVSEDLRKLQEMVERVKHDEEVAIRYMRMWEEEERIFARAKEEGREEGETVRLLRQIQRKISRGKSLAEIADDLEDSEESIRPLYEAVQKYGVDCTAENIYEKMHEKDV